MPGFQELLVIVVVALLAVGPERLPVVARKAATLMARLQREAHGVLRDLKAEANLEDLGTELGHVRRQLHDPASETLEEPQGPPIPGAGQGEGPVELPGVPQQGAPRSHVEE